MTPTNEEIFRMIVENGEDFFAVLDLDGHRIYNSPSYARLLGDAAHLKGSDSFVEIHPDDRERVRKAFQNTVRHGDSHRLHYRFLLPDGQIRHMESCGNLIRDSQGNPLRVVVVSRDITERVESEREMQNLAFHDELTNLPNRRLLSDRLNHTMAASKRTGKHSALMLLDLDNFKELNDRHGHTVGDLLLIEVSHRITGCLRETDTVARLGGDEFVVLLSELHHDQNTTKRQAFIVAEKIRTALSAPYTLKKTADQNSNAVEIVHQCTVSIGIALFINHEVDAQEILRQADTAMYQAKQAGRNMIRFFAA
jgi:diguanylate cyclase (GGDEF)-like protein/PAS domain S-box-containing protein